MIGNRIILYVPSYLIFVLIVSDPDTVLYVMMLSLSESAVLRARVVLARLIDKYWEPGYYSYCIKIKSVNYN